MSDLQGTKENTNLVVLKPRRSMVISQRDLEELTYLTRKMIEATNRYRKKHAEVRNALLSGASIEPGVHIAELSTKVVIR